MSYIYRYNLDELFHYGVPGMRWGHRKQVTINRRTLGSRKQIIDVFKTQRNSINTKLADKIQKRNLKKIEKHNKKIDKKVAKYKKLAEGLRKSYLEDIKNLKTDSDTQYLYQKYGLDLNQEIKDMEEAMKDTRKYYEKKINDLLASKK